MGQTNMRTKGLVNLFIILMRNENKSEETQINLGGI